MKRPGVTVTVSSVYEIHCHILLVFGEKYITVSSVPVHIKAHGNSFIPVMSFNVFS